MIKIKFAETDAAIKNCFSTMKELRNAIENENVFLQKIKKQMKIADFNLVFLEDEGEVKSAAGIRVSENLAWGKYLYVDDLITKSSERSKGYGDKLFDWIVEYAKSIKCEQLHLDSGVQRFDAHRFYLRKKMFISSHHFSLKLK